MRGLIARLRARRPVRGQAMVEFALTIVIFLMLAMGIFDLGRAVYTYNGLSESARVIARVASVHPGDTPGVFDSPEITTAITAQKSLVLSLEDPIFSCVDITGATVIGPCLATDGNSVRVTVNATYTPATPLLGLTGTWNLNSSSSVIVQ